MTAYRPEIDGLRALAVLPVILFHAGFAGFSGGYVGVDVFFVISGYLITSILLKEMQDGNFSLIRFYERRARRILPALFFVMAVTMPFAWWWLIPRDLQDFGESLIAVATFSSNVLFWLESGYFATEAGLKPLLHTWSLAVEEQYYILFPLFLLAVWRLGSRWITWLIVAGVIAGVAAAHWGAFHKPLATYYLLPTRAWEILLGALAAIFLFRQPADGSTGLWREVCGFGGLALVVASIVYFDSHTPFPSLYTLVPTIGTLLIILGAQTGTVSARWLGSPIPVTVGLLSYSAYLWHQPLLAFGHYQSLQQPSGMFMGLLCALTFPLAWITWRYIETPLRDGNRFSRSFIFTGAATAMTFFVVVGMELRGSGGAPERLPPDIARVAEMGTTFVDYLDAEPCNIKRDDTRPVHCVRGANTPPTTMLLGDSHAISLVPEMSRWYQQHGESFVQDTKIACPFALGFDSSEESHCGEFVQAIIDDESLSPIETVIVLSRWSYYLHDAAFENGIGGREVRDTVTFTAAGLPFGADESLRRNAILDAYAQSIQKLRRPGRTIFVVLPIPEQGWDVPRLLARIAMNTDGTAEVPPTPLPIYEHRHAELMSSFAELTRQQDVVFIDPSTVFCNRSRTAREGCISTMDGEPLYFDDDHLTDRGAEMLVAAIQQQIEDVRLQARTLPEESHSIASANFLR